MKEIQEKRLENELKFIKESNNNNISNKITKLNTEGEFQVDITIQPSSTIYSNNIHLVLIIHKNFPFNPPKLYFKTKFAFPHLCDGRDFLEDILGSAWVTKYRLIDIINKIPQFVNEYLKSLNEGYLSLAGKYYLGDKYNLEFLESLPIYSKRIKEKEEINGKHIEVNKLLIVSDLYFCLFEIDKKHKNSGTLTFWSNIKALITIKRIVKENECILIWRNKFEHKKAYEISIIVPNGEEIVKLMVQKMESFGVKYNISQKKLGTKEGKLPICDIDLIEKNIEELEKKISDKEPKVEDVQKLISLYEKAIEFYSAMNNPRYEHFMKKTQECMKMQIMINVTDNKIKEGNDNNDNKELQTESKKEISKTEDEITNTNVQNPEIENNQNDIAQSINNKINRDNENTPTEQTTSIVENLPITSSENNNSKTSAKIVHVQMSNDDDDNPIDVGSDEDDEDN